MWSVLAAVAWPSSIRTLHAGFDSPQSDAVSRRRIRRRNRHQHFSKVIHARRLHQVMVKAGLNSPFPILVLPVARERDEHRLMTLARPHSAGNFIAIHSR